MEQINLTDREMDVLYLITLGKSNKYISKTLFISNSTVKAHLTNIYKKLGVENRTEAAIFAKDKKIIHPPDSKLP